MKSNTKRKWTFWCFFLIIPLIISYVLINNIWFLDTENNSIFAPWDSSIPISKINANQSLSLLSSKNGGSKGAVPLLVSSADSMLYKAISNFGIRGFEIQKIFLIVEISILIMITTYGFLKLHDLLNINSGKSKYRISIEVGLITGIYLISPFNLMFMSYGVIWTLTTILAIGTLPLLCYYLINITFFKHHLINLKNQIIFALLIALHFYSLLFLFPVFFMMVLLLPFISIKAIILRTRLSILFLVISTLPALFIIIVDRYYSGVNVHVPDYLGNAAYGNIKNGFLFPILQISSWIIYTEWSPRVILGFSDHFFSIYYLVIEIIIFILAVISLLIGIKKAETIRLWLGLVLLGSIFFAKGVNPPFGSVFEWLVNNIFIFELIRTPDTKIGIIILIVISILLLMLIGRIKDYFFYLIIIPIIVVCIIYNAIPILNKEAPLGINSKYLSNSSYVTVLGKDELAIINYLNEDSNSNVFPIPGQYALHSEIDKSIFAHRDIIANNVKNPFFYREMSEVSDYRVANAIEQFFIYKNIESLDYLNIKYILIKKNVIGKVGGEALIFSELVNLWKNESKVKLAVTTESYDLFEIINPPVATKNNNIKFIEVTPYREVLEIYNQHGWVTTIEKFGSYNSNWLPILISNRCDGYWYRICFYDGLYRSINSDLFINISDPNAENPKNVWRLNVSNELFKETLRVEIFYIPQFLLFLIIIFTFFAFSLIIIFVIIKNIRINEK